MRAAPRRTAPRRAATRRTQTLALTPLPALACALRRASAPPPRRPQPLFTFGCVCQLLVFVVLMTHLRAIAIEHDTKPESKAFTWLSWCAPGADAAPGRCARLGAG